MPLGHSRDARDHRRHRRRGGRDAGGDGEARRRLVAPAIGEARSTGCAGRRGRSCRARRARRASARRSAAVSRATSPNVARDRGFRRPHRASRRGSISSTAAHRACGRGRRRGAGLSAAPSPPHDRAPGSAVARSRRSPAGPAPASIRSSAPPIRSSSSGSPIGISRGSSRPAPLARTNASVTRAHRAVVGQQDPALREPERLPAEARDQPRRERIGERAVRRDGVDRDPARVRHSRAPLPSSGSTAGVPTSNHSPWWTAPKRGLRRSRGPTGCWSKTARRARLAAGASRPSGFR